MLFNQFLAEGKFPEALKKAVVTSFFKKGENSLPENYRQKSITSSLAKVFERLLREQNRKLSITQATKNHSMPRGMDSIGLYQGVPQGTVLDRLLLNLYINDLNKQIPAR